MQHRQSIAGFTLIELMLTVLIASIITAIALPSYRNYSYRTRITEATSQLTAYRLMMEQSFQDNQAYGKNKVCNLTFNNTENFSYACATLNDDQSYKITATGNKKNNMNEFSYTIDEKGNTATLALPAGWGTVPKDCWVLKVKMECL